MSSFLSFYASLCCVVLCGVVWCGVVWCGVVLCCVVLCCVEQNQSTECWNQLFLKHLFYQLQF